MPTTAEQIVQNMAEAMDESDETRKQIGDALGNSFPDAIENAASSIDNPGGEKTISRSEFEDLSSSKKREVATSDTRVVAE